MRVFNFLHGYIPTLQDCSSGHEDLIDNFFHLGLEYTEIFLFLELFHGIQLLSLQQLKQIFEAKGLGRGRSPSNLRKVCQVVEEELGGSGTLMDGIKNSYF